MARQRTDERGDEGDGEKRDGEQPVPPARDDEPARWYRSGPVVAVVVVDVLLLLVVAAGTTTLFQGLVPVSALGLGTGGSLSVTVPWEVYAFGVLGAFGYVFTALLRDFERTPKKVVQYHLRVPAAVPLAAGVYLFSGVIIGGGTTAGGGSGSGPVAFVENETLMAGLAFLSGLYVNLAYERLSALADRLLPDRGADEGTSSERSGSEG